MVKTEYRNADEGVVINANGNIFTIMAEEMLCIERFHATIQDHDDKLAMSFRSMVLAWAKGDFDD